MNTDRVKRLVDEALKENSSLFLIDLKFGKDSGIQVIVDGDSGVPLSECIRISRHIEHNLDREEDDFSLVVTTPDISDNLVDIRQYRKNLGRIMKIDTEHEKYEGKLVQADEDEIVLQWKTREPKPVGKGKVTVEKEAKILLKDIIKAKVKIIF